MYYFPYTNFHDINLDWIIEYVKSAKSEIEDLINQFENLIVQTTGDSTNKVMSQNAVTLQLNFLSSRINTLNTTVEELTAKLNEDIANLAEFETETASNFSSDRNRLSTIENSLTRFYVIVTHTAESNTLNVSFSDLLNYRNRANVRYYIRDTVNSFVRAAYEVGTPTSTTMQIQTSPYSQENKIYRADISVASSSIIYSTLAIIAVAQSSGTSQTSVMSQRAVTNLVESLDKIVKVTVTETSDKTFTADYTYDEISDLIDAGALIYCTVKITDTHYEYYMLTRRIPNNLYFAEVYTTIRSVNNKQLIININNIVQITENPAIATFTLMSDGETVPSSQLSTLQNILNAINVNAMYPQIYLKITTDNVNEQLYVDSANSTRFVLRNNNYIITYTTTPSVTIEPVEKVFTSSATGIVRIAEGGATGYSILKIIGTDVDLTNYYIVDADITNLIGGDSKLISVSPVSGVPVILIYTNAVAFSGSWTVTCRHK